jgi:hypothetical protein
VLASVFVTAGTAVVLAFISAVTFCYVCAVSETCMNDCVAKWVTPCLAPLFRHLDSTPQYIVGIVEPEVTVTLAQSPLWSRWDSHGTHVTTFLLSLRINVFHWHLSSLNLPVQFTDWLCGHSGTFFRRGSTLSVVQKYIICKYRKYMQIIGTELLGWRLAPAVCSR